MNTDMQNRIAAYWNAIRSVVAPDDYITATVLIDEVKKRSQGQSGEETADQVYAFLLEAADI